MIIVSLLDLTVPYTCIIQANKMHGKLQSSNLGPFSYPFVDDIANPEELISEYYSKFRRGDMNLDDKLEETEFLYFEHPEHNPQSIKDLVEDMISNFDKNQDKVKKLSRIMFRCHLVKETGRCFGLMTVFDFKLESAGRVVR